MIAALAATWPPAALHRAGPFVVGEGQGGGQRVASARILAPCEDWPLAITMAEGVMRDLGQTPLFQIRVGQDMECDRALAARGYAIGDEVALLSRPLTDALPADPAVTAKWPPTPAQADLWAAEGITAARLAVMARVAGPHAALAIRHEGQLAGCAFVALAGDIACLHALEVAAPFRRKGLGRRLTLAAAHWAQSAGARDLALLVVTGNAPARALYDALGFAPVGRMHYRKAPA